MFGLTFCVSSVGVVRRQLLQIVFQQHLVARDSLHGLQHVMLERQAATDLLNLSRNNQNFSPLSTFCSIFAKCAHSALWHESAFFQVTRTLVALLKVHFFGWWYLDLLNGGLELRRTVSPLFEQLHGLVEILHILCVHLEEGCEFQQDVSDARFGRPEGRERRRYVNHNVET